MVDSAEDQRMSAAVAAQKVVSLLAASSLSSASLQALAEASKPVIFSVRLNFGENVALLDDMELVHAAKEAVRMRGKHT